MIDRVTLAAVVLMAAVTYLTRVAGFLALRNRVLSAKVMNVMEAAPGCVLIAVIAPQFVSNRPADLIALLAALAAASRLSMLPTVIVAVATAAILRHVLA